MEEHVENSADPHGKPGPARRFSRWLLTIVALCLVSAVVDKALEPKTRGKIRDLDEAFIAQLGRIEPFHFAKVYYHYVESGTLPQRKPARHYVDFADEYRANSGPSAPGSHNLFVNLLIGPFVVLYYTWTEGVVAFLVSLFALTLGAIACWDKGDNFLGKIVATVITGSFIIWVLWAVAWGLGTLLHPLIDWAAMITTVPFAGLLGKTIVEERQHHFVTSMLGKVSKSSSGAH